MAGSKADKKARMGPGEVARLAGALFRTPKCCRVDSRPGRTPSLQVPSLVGARIGGNKSMFLPHIDVFLSPLFLSLPSSLSKINKHIISEDLKNYKLRKPHVIDISFKKQQLL